MILNLRDFELDGLKAQAELLPFGELAEKLDQYAEKLEAIAARLVEA
ncbi:MAG: hypothetical protein P8X52_05610 [Limibacillus sp.]